MKNTIGHPAQKENFFPRPKEIEKILRRIKAGGHIQLAAPRRVGKTSILMFLRDNPIEGYHFVYVDTEDVASTDEYFKKIYQEILRSDFIGRSAKIRKQVEEKGNKFLDRIKSVKLFGQGIDLNDGVEADYYNELLNFVKGIDLDGSKIILLNDEFPFTIENIIEANDNDPAKAIDFLKLNRALRQDPDFREKFQFVYTGSIGLNALMDHLGKTELVNDVAPVTVTPLSVAEGKELIAAVLNTYDYLMTDEVATYLLSTIELLIPFYIQLALQEIMELTDVQEISQTSIVDKAMLQMIEYKNNNYFDNYFTRLRKQFKGKEFDFVIALICGIAKGEITNRNQIHDQAVKYGVEDKLKPILGTMEYDGYLHYDSGRDMYFFYSPILKKWWLKYVCN